jgi:serine/threonine-protein kinase RsbW
MDGVEDLSPDVGEGDAPLVSAPPPDTFRLERSWVLDSPEQLSALRTSILMVVTRDDVAPPEALDDVAESMVLIASELATNALKYAYPPTVVRLLREGDTYLLDVADRAPGTAPYVAVGRPEGQGGLGLQIARRLACDVGWYADGDEKHVWAIVPAAS